MKLSELIKHLQKFSHIYKDLEVWKGKIRPLDKSDISQIEGRFEISSEYSNTILYGVEAIDCLGIPCLQYIATNKETALEGVKLLQKNYRHTTMGRIYIIKYDRKELINASKHDLQFSKHGSVEGIYGIEHSPAVMDKNYKKVQNELEIIRNSNKISLEYEGSYGSSILLRLNFGGLVDRQKLFKRVDNFIKKFNGF